MSVNKLKPTIEDVVKLLKLGQQIRDKHNLNRFRLVLMGHLDKELYEICQIKAQEFDERIHIHVIEV